jgi:hypothetical protein
VRWLPGACNIAQSVYQRILQFRMTHYHYVASPRRWQTASAIETKTATVTILS